MKTLTETTRKTLTAALISQLKGKDQLMQQIRGSADQKNLSGVVLEHGVGKFGARLPTGMRKLAYRLCFMHATSLMLKDPRYIYCEGYAVREALGLTLGEHAWVLDRERDWAVVDNTWKDPITAIYVGIPFSNDFVMKCALSGRRVYGVLDRHDLGHPVLTESPETWLHPDAALIPKDF